MNITVINDFGEFILVGGYTTSEGYKGFSNPKIIVINKKSHKIVYQKYITLKDKLINKIKIDAFNNIIISISSILSNAEKQIPPKIIIDKLDQNGKFKNDLFFNE